MRRAISTIRLTIENAPLASDLWSAKAIGIIRRSCIAILRSLRLPKGSPAAKKMKMNTIPRIAAPALAYADQPAKRFSCEVVISVSLLHCSDSYAVCVTSPTVCVTGRWAGVDKVWEQEKLEARKMLEN